MSHPNIRRYAVFVTPHGYGHAARASAVMNAMSQVQPEAFFEIYTRVPVWFFNMSVQTGMRFHEVLTDIGLSQTTAMHVNLPETIERLNQFLPFSDQLVKSLAQQVCEQGCEKVLCDISPLGIAVAREAGLPSILVENFTWDWIYEGYLAEEPLFAPHIAYLHEAFASATYHIRTQPACDFRIPADMLTERGQPQTAHCIEPHARKAGYYSREPTGDDHDGRDPYPVSISTPARAGGRCAVSHSRQQRYSMSAAAA
jgi:hypothetical protein